MDLFDRILASIGALAILFATVYGAFSLCSLRKKRETYCSFEEELEINIDALTASGAWWLFIRRLSFERAHLSSEGYADLIGRANYHKGILVGQEQARTELLMQDIPFTVFHALITGAKPWLSWNSLSSHRQNAYLQLLANELERLLAEDSLESFGQALRIRNELESLYDFHMKVFEKVIREHLCDAWNAAVVAFMDTPNEALLVLKDMTDQEYEDILAGAERQEPFGVHMLYALNEHQPGSFMQYLLRRKIQEVRKAAADLDDERLVEESI